MRFGSYLSLLSQFQKQQQLKLLKQQMLREMEHHTEQSKHHQDVVERTKRRIQELEEEAQEKWSNQRDGNTIGRLTFGKRWIVIFRRDFNLVENCLNLLSSDFIKTNDKTDKKFCDVFFVYTLGFQPFISVDQISVKSVLQIWFFSFCLLQNFALLLIFSTLYLAIT